MVVRADKYFIPFIPSLKIPLWGVNRGNKRNKTPHNPRKARSGGIYPTLRQWYIILFPLFQSSQSTLWWYLSLLFLIYIYNTCSSKMGNKRNKTLLLVFIPCFLAHPFISVFYSLNLITLFDLVNIGRSPLRFMCVSLAFKYIVILSQKGFRSFR